MVHDGTLCLARCLQVDVLGLAYGQVDVRSTEGESARFRCSNEGRPLTPNERPVLLRELLGA